MADIEAIWQRLYECAPLQLEKIAEVKTAATAFNTNIDAVLRIKGDKIAALAQQVGLTEADLQSNDTGLENERDVVRGIIKCFGNGIAEEWIADKKSVYEWMRDNLGYTRLQMGGQGGIVANILAVTGVRKVVAHTNSHPQLQADQFLKLENLLGFDENGTLAPACSINRQNDVPLIHWIIEFAKGDSFEYLGKQYVCPKANRFIATYDPANMMLKTDENFVRYLQQNGFDYLILSGYHSLTSLHNGVNLVRESAENIKMWKAACPRGIVHLELASTQDKMVRKAILEKIAPLADSIGLNDREALDALEIINPQMYERCSNEPLTAAQMFDILYCLATALNVQRIQLHMFGLYITLQKLRGVLSAEQNLHGMILAAEIAATKAMSGKVDNYNMLLAASGEKIEVSVLQNLAAHVGGEVLLQTGICQYKGYEVIAVPTIIVEKPVTLVGMGDTISSLSLVGAR
ncbi:MAG: ADP-dependent glucokinase/phosphofructokinase [Alphaproteobacteria bacterium]|nr:ADP-dependent glucokinase/phosphofructokinase [Alphaproteobacteria bacterium]